MNNRPMLQTAPPDSPYETVVWINEFRDENDKVLLAQEFIVPPARISVGDFVSFSQYSFSGTVIKIAHLLREPDDLKLLRHVIEITLDTNEKE